jgi:hypothetical protein
MATKRYDAVATVGEYTKNGETKKRYMNVGVVFENDKGQLSLKLDALPTGKEWSGYINFYDPKDTQDSTPATRAQASHNQAKANAYQPPQTSRRDDDSFDEIPF